MLQMKNKAKDIQLIINPHLDTRVMAIEKYPKF